MATCLRVELLPVVTVTAFFLSPNASASSFSSARLARPPSGGAVTRTFSAPSSQPAISSLAACGTTLTARSVAAFLAFNAI